jgi:uncharacterized protein DUF6335
VKSSKHPARGRARTSGLRRGSVKKKAKKKKAKPPEVERRVAPPAGQPGAGPRLSGGDVDADWQRAESTGEEAVGGSVATPDQDGGRRRLR